MKKIVLLLLVGLACTPGWAQEPSWKDSVKTKQKPLNAYFADDVIYFQTKKGWGVYDRNSQTTLVPPVYQFVKRMNDGFYVVQKNKVGYLNGEGGVVDPPVYTRLGYGVRAEMGQSIKNDQLFSGDQPIGAYPMMDEFTENSVTVHDGKVFVNEFRETYPVPFVRVLPDGSYIDSVDVMGNTVYMQPLLDNRSGIFDLAENKWMDLFDKSAKVGFCKGNILSRIQVNREKNPRKEFRILDAPSGKLYSIVDTGNVLRQKKNILRILSDYSPGFIYCIDSTQTEELYHFESNGKYGLYNPYTFTVWLEPVYDFVYAKGNWVYTVKNGKVGLMDLFKKKTLYDNLYESLEIHHLRYDEYPHPVVFCNDDAYEGLEMDKEYPSTLPSKGVIEAKTGRPHNFTGLQVFNGKMVIHDYCAPYELQMIDPATEESIVTNYPGACYGGVFDPVARKWLVKPQYSLVRPSEQGYACKQMCNRPFTYSYFGREGKPVFEKKTIDSLQKDNQALARLMHQGTARVKTKWLLSDDEDEKAIVSVNNQWGVFDVNSLQWKVNPVHQFVDYHGFMGYYTVVDSGKMGLLTQDFKVLVPALYTRLDLLYEHNLISANDTFLYSPDTLNLLGKTDTLKDLEHYFEGRLSGRNFLNLEIVDKKLYAEEELFDPEAMTYTMEGEGIIKSIDSTASHVSDLTTGEQVWFDKGWRLRKWDKGYIALDAQGVFRAYDDGGKNRVELHVKDSVGCTGQWFYSWEPDENYFYDPQGKIVPGGALEKAYFSKTYLPVGYNYHYFDGNKMLEGPKNFRIMCANASGLLLGYEVVADAQTQKPAKHYRYYDTGTKQYSRVELELTDSPIRIFPVKDGFVLFDYNRAERQYNCTVLENDLKTVKSSFKKLTGYSAARSYTALHPVPYYELYTDKKIVYFNRDFQFLHECNYQDRLQVRLGYNRIFLQSKFKTLIMDWKGRLIRQ